MFACQKCVISLSLFFLSHLSLPISKYRDFICPDSCGYRSPFQNTYRSIIVADPQDREGDNATVAANNAPRGRHRQRCS